MRIESSSKFDILCFHEIVATLGFNSHFNDFFFRAANLFFFFPSAFINFLTWICDFYCAKSVDRINGRYCILIYLTQSNRSD